MTQPEPNEAEQWRQFQEWKAWQAQQQQQAVPPKKTSVPWWGALLAVALTLVLAWGVAAYYANDNTERRPTIRVVPNR